LIKIYFDLNEYFIITIPKLAFGLNLCFLTICLNLNYKLEARVATLDKKQKKPNENPRNEKKCKRRAKNWIKNE
jgi:hypothetical protein